MVVAKALSRCPKGSLRVVAPGDPSYGVGPEMLQGLFGAERTEHGVLCLPDIKGCGPIYVAVLDKVGETHLPTKQLVDLGDEEDEDEEEEEEEQGMGEGAEGGEAPA